MDWTPASRGYTQVQAGQDMVSVPPTYVDPRADPVWLSQLGFSGDPWAQVPLADTSQMVYNAEAGGWGTIVYDPVNGGSNFVVASLSYTDAFSAYVARRGMQEQFTYVAGPAKLVRWVDRNGNQVGPTKNFALANDSIAMALVLAGIGAVAGPAIASGSLTSQQAATVATQTEVATVSSAYEQALDPFSYTSGEAVSVSSDAANVSYGFAAPADAPALELGAANSYPGDFVFSSTEVPTVAVNATPETLVNDFGVVNYEPGAAFDGGMAVAAGEQAGVPVAVSPGAPGTVLGSTTGATSGGGALGQLLKGIFAPSQAKPPTSGNSALQAQNEASQGRDFLGQLGLGYDPANPSGMGLGGIVAMVLGVGIVAYAAFK